MRLHARRFWKCVRPSGLVVLALCGAVLGTGCVPKVELKSVKVADLRLDRVTLASQVDVTNRFRVELPVTGAALELKVQGKTLARSSSAAASVPPSETKTIDAKATFEFAPLFDTAVDTFKGKKVDYELAASLSWRSGEEVRSTPAKSVLRGVLPIPRLPVIALTALPILSFDDFTLKATVPLSVRNTNEFPVEIKELKGSLSVKDPGDGRTWIRLGGFAAISPGACVSGGTRNVTVIVSVPFGDIPERILAALRGATNLENFRVSGSLKLEIEGFTIPISYP